MLKVNITKTVQCDRCGNAVEFSERSSKARIVDRLRKADWSIGKKCLCPSCRETPQAWHKRRFEQYRMEI